MRGIGNFFDHAVNFLAYLSGALITFTFLSISTEVVMRYFFNRPIVWVVDAAEYVLVSSAFLAAAWVLKKEGHVSLDVGLNFFNTKNRAAINTATSLLGAIICLVVIWYGVVTTIYHSQAGTIMVEKSVEVYKAPFLTVIPIGFSLLFIQFLRRAYGYLGKWRVPPEEEEKRIEEFTEI